MIINQCDREKMIQENIAAIQQRIQNAAKTAGRDPTSIQCMAVTKTVPVSLVNTALQGEILLLGENRVQEMLQKYSGYHLEQKKLHFIGHLQRNKVKYIIDKVDMIESVDTIELAVEIDKRARQHAKIMPILLQINIGMEKTKSGFNASSIYSAIENLSRLPNLSIEGLMTIPPKQAIERYFAEMQNLYIDIKDKYVDNINMHYLSMGMSRDFETAIQYGSNIVRIGTAIFGNRKYPE